MKQIIETDLEKLKHKDQVRFALFCAYQVKNSWKDIPECVEAIKTVELWLEGKASSKECEQATNKATYASYNVANYIATGAASAVAYTAFTAAYTTDSAIRAIRAANAIKTPSPKLRKAQWNYYYELLNFEKNFEKIVLGVR